MVNRPVPYIWDQVGYTFNIRERFGVHGCRWLLHAHCWIMWSQRRKCSAVQIKTEDNNDARMDLHVVVHSQKDGFHPNKQCPTVQYDLAVNHSQRSSPTIKLRLDPTTATGRRLNVREDAPTEYERRMENFNPVDGFGTFHQSWYL